MDEKKMTLEELVGWLDDNDVSYEIDDAGKLTVKGDLTGNFRDWVRTRECTSLPGELVHVDGNLWLERTSITSLGSLASVGWSLDLRETPIISLGNLTSVGGDLDLEGVPITSLDNLTSVGGWLDLRGTSITSLGNLTSVGGGLDLWNTPITSLGNLPQVGEDLCLDRDQFQLLTREALRKVAESILYWGLAENERIALSTAELETIVAENEQRESLHNTRGSDVDWDLYDR